MAASDWERLLLARGRRRMKIVVRHVVRRPLLIAGLILFQLLKSSFPSPTASRLRPERS
ncbi:hypothetical protein ACFY83_32680 [Streptomyces althioticus]|uniref:hypothetical protein n=1 Tax=Streptomyces althioticus TaxID=83380 RepID=UPI0036E256F5